MHVDPDGFVDQGDQNSQNLYGITVEAPNETGSQVRVLNFSEYSNRYDRTMSQSDDLEAEAGTFVNNTYPAYESGEIDPNQVISRNTAMFNLAADEVDGNNSMFRSTAALGMMGLDVPNLNETGTMTVDYRQTEYNGLLLADEAPGGAEESPRAFSWAHMVSSVLNPCIKRG
jgi:hypothetical protein